MVVPLVSSLESLDNSLIEAAYDLGAGGFAILRTIVIPHAAPGITAGCIVVFMLTLGNYLTPTLLGGKNSQWFTEQIYTQFITRFNWEQGAAFGFLLLALSTALVMVGLAARRPAVRRRDAANMIPSLPRPLWLRAATAVYLLAFLAFLFLPLAVVGGVRLQRCALPGAAVARLYARLVPGQLGARAASGLFADSELLGSIWTSCVVAVWVTRAVGCWSAPANAFLLERGTLSRQAGSVRC